MGARVYLPSLGRFLQIDPVENGVDNNYVYPTQPVTTYDLTGEWAGVAKGAVTACMAFKRQCMKGVVYGWGKVKKVLNKTPKISIQIKKSGPDHYWPNKKGVNGRGWYKHIEVNIKLSNRKTGKTTKFIHKQIHYGKAYKYKHGNGGGRL